MNLTGILKKIISGGSGAAGRNKARIGALLVTAAAGLFVISEHEKDSPEYAFYKADGTGRLKRDVRIVYLSDLHEKEFGRDNRRLVSMIDDAGPDMILIGGDMVTAGDVPRTEVSLSLIKELASRYRVYFGLGNHEQRMKESVERYGEVWHRYETELASAGVRILDDRSVVTDEGLQITGLNLGKDQYGKVSPKGPEVHDLERRTGPLDRNRFNVLLVHSPLFEKQYARLGADLTLAGHFHGGTIRLPGRVGLMTPQYQFFSNRVVGEYVYKGMKLIISAGLGTHSVNIRLNDRPQVVVVDIKTAKKI